MNSRALLLRLSSQTGMARGDGFRLMTLVNKAVRCLEKMNQKLCEVKSGTESLKQNQQKSSIPYLFLRCSDYCVMLKWGQADRERRNAKLKPSLPLPIFYFALYLPQSGASTARQEQAGWSEHSCDSQTWKEKDRKGRYLGYLEVKVNFNLKRKRI